MDAVANGDLDAMPKVVKTAHTSVILHSLASTIP